MWVNEDILGAWRQRGVLRSSIGRVGDRDGTTLFVLFSVFDSAGVHLASLAVAAEGVVHGHLLGLRLPRRHRRSGAALRLRAALNYRREPPRGRMTRGVAVEAAATLCTTPREAAPSARSLQ